MRCCVSSQPSALKRWWSGAGSNRRPSAFQAGSPVSSETNGSILPAARARRLIGTRTTRVRPAAPLRARNGRASTQARSATRQAPFTPTLGGVPEDESALFVPLRSNANTLLTGRPIVAMRTRLKYASVFYDRLYLEAGILHMQAGPNGAAASWSP